MERNVLSLYLSKVASGDDTYLEKLCARLAERLIFVPLADPEDNKKSKKNSNTKISILKAVQGDKTCVPVFTSEKKFKDWCNEQGNSFEVFSLLGVDFAAVVDPDAWLIVDPGSDNSVVLSPDTVDMIAQDLFIEVFENEKKMKDQAAVDLAHQMAAVSDEPEPEPIKALSNGAGKRPAAPAYEEVNPFAEEPALVAQHRSLEPDEPPQVIEPREELASADSWQPAGARPRSGERAAPSKIETFSAPAPAEEEQPAPLFVAADPIEPQPAAPVFVAVPAEDEAPATLDIFSKQARTRQRDEDDESASQEDRGSGGSRVFDRDGSVPGGADLDDITNTQEFPRVETPQRASQSKASAMFSRQDDEFVAPGKRGEEAPALFTNPQVKDQSEWQPPVTSRVRPAADPRARGAQQPGPDASDPIRPRRAALQEPEEAPALEQPQSDDEPPLAILGLRSKPKVAVSDDEPGSDAGGSSSEPPLRSRRPTLWQGSSDNAPNDTNHRGLQRLREEIAAGTLGSEPSDAPLESPFASSRKRSPFEPVDEEPRAIAQAEEPPAPAKPEVASDTPDEPGAGFLAARRSAMAAAQQAASNEGSERTRSSTGSYKREDLQPSAAEGFERPRKPSSSNLRRDAEMASSLRPRKDTSSTGAFSRDEINKAVEDDGGFARPRKGGGGGLGGEAQDDGFSRPHNGDAGATGTFSRPEGGFGDAKATGSFTRPEGGFEAPQRGRGFGSIEDAGEDLGPTTSRPYSPRGGAMAEDEASAVRSRTRNEEITNTHEFDKPKVDRRSSGSSTNLLEPNHSEKVYFPKDAKTTRPGARASGFGDVGESEEETAPEREEPAAKKKKGLFDFLKR